MTGTPPEPDHPDTDPDASSMRESAVSGDPETVADRGTEAMPAEDIP